MYIAPVRASETALQGLGNLVGYSYKCKRLWEPSLRTVDKNLHGRLLNGDQFDRQLSPGSGDEKGRGNVESSASS